MRFEKLSQTNAEHICIHYHLSAKQIIGGVRLFVGTQIKVKANVLSVEMDAGDSTKIIKAHTHTHTHALLIQHSVDEDGSHCLACVMALYRCKVTCFHLNTKHTHWLSILNFTPGVHMIILPSVSSFCGRGQSRLHKAHYTWY